MYMTITLVATTATNGHTLKNNGIQKTTGYDTVGCFLYSTKENGRYDGMGDVFFYGGLLCYHANDLIYCQTYMDVAFLEKH
jgi:hypothetical protein